MGEHIQPMKISGYLETPGLKARRKLPEENV